MAEQVEDDQRKNKSLMWAHFTKFGNRRVKCNICNCEYKYSNNTSNLKDHLKRKHPEKLGVSSSSNNDEGNPDRSIDDIIEEPNRSVKYNINSSRKKHLDKLFVKMIALDMEPLRLSEREGLREFVNALDSRYDMPSRTVISEKHLPRIHNAMKLELMEVLSKIPNIAITTDMWTSRSNQGICALTCHFILQNQLHSCLLEAVAIEGNHDANTLSSVVGRILEDWNCRQKVTAIVTDNAPVMPKMADILKIRHIPCFAHCLNLVIKHVLTIPELNDLLNKCRQIVTFFKHSTLASDELLSTQKNLNKPVLKLKQQVDTRWNSALYMVSRILQVREELTLVLSKNVRAPENFTADEFSLLEEIEKIFDPIETCTVAVSGDTYSTISLIIPLIKGLAIEFTKLEKENFSETAKVVLQQLRTQIEIHLKPYEARTACIASTLLNPHFKKMGFKTGSDAEKAVSCVQREYAAFLHSNRSQTPRTETEENSSSSTVHARKKTKLNNLLSYLSDAAGASASTSVTSDAIIDIRQYVEKPILPSTEFPIEYWTYSENNLKHVALKYLGIPATSTPAERIFSKAGEIMTERRNRLCSGHLNALLFIKQNNAILEKIKK